MQHTRTALSVIVRASSRTHMIPLRSNVQAAIHTTRTISAEEKRGFLSRLNPFAKPDVPSSTGQSVAQEAKAAAELNVEIAEEEAPIPSWKSERLELSRGELEETIRSAVATIVDTTNLRLSKVQLNDPTVKFQASLDSCSQSAKG
ncbi:hypothetical protein BGZ83_002187 [Gryganskiella cystojenkinii]|nr:hypothetical protein BGZ83_002187 [Gryganskiella cystojenkinii]